MQFKFSSGISEKQFVLPKSIMWDKLYDALPLEVVLYKWTAASTIWFNLIDDDFPTLGVTELYTFTVAFSIEITVQDTSPGNIDLTPPNSKR